MGTDSHTPGPWVAEIGDDPVEAGHSIWVVDGPNGSICDLTCPADEQEATARLIAAAPAMKEALRELLAICRQEFGGTSLDGPSQYRPAMNRARAALAAASTQTTGDAT